MAGSATRLIFLGFMAFAVAACSGTGKEADINPNIVPTNYKQEILDSLTRLLDDPTNVREAFISEPALTVAPGSKEQRYTVCVRYNPRVSPNQYEGKQERIGTFFGGRLNQFVEARERCTNAAYKPFPELEKLCLAKKCE